MDRILFDDNRISPNDVAEAILERVKKDNVRVSIVWEHDHTELTVEPWEPFEMKCPYGKN